LLITTVDAIHDPTVRLQFLGQANVDWENPIIGSRRKLIVTGGVVAIACLLFGCWRAQRKAEPEPVPEVRISLSPLGLPKNFFSTGDEAPRLIIGYRFVVWLNSQDVVVGFNTSPNSRIAPDRKVDGSARILVFSVDGKLKAKRDITYLADGWGEVVAEGEATAGPRGTLLFQNTVGKS
jgi:hypothetical protein